MSAVGKPGYKESNLGWIPQDWMELPLGDICRPQQWQTISSQELTPTGYPVYGANGQIGFYESFNHEKETVAVTCRGATCGSVTLVPPKSYITGNAMCLDDIDTNRSIGHYLYQALLYRGFRDVITGSAQPQITGASIRKVSLAIPPLPEQQKIAAILTTVDDKLDVIVRRIEATQILKQGVMQTLFSRGVGTQDAIGHWTPHTEFKDSEVGEVPKLWSVKEIGEALSVVERPVKMTDDQLYRRVTVRRRHGGVELRDELPGADIKVKNQFLLEAGDFLISERQIVHGACGIVPEHLAGALVSNEYLVLQAREGFDVTFFSYLVQLLKYAKLFLICSQGVDIEKFLFKPKDWLKKRIPVPPLAEQQRIAEILAAVEEKTNALQRKQSEYQNLKRGLMQKLLTGELRVKLDSPSGTA